MVIKNTLQNKRWWWWKRRRRQQQLARIFLNYSQHKEIMKQFLDSFDDRKEEKKWTAALLASVYFFSPTNTYRIKSQLAVAMGLWIIDALPNFLNKIFYWFLLCALVSLSFFFPNGLKIKSHKMSLFSHSFDLVTHDRMGMEWIGSDWIGTTDNSLSNWPRTTFSARCGLYTQWFFPMHVQCVLRTTVYFMYKCKQAHNPKTNRFCQSTHFDNNTR